MLIEMLASKIHRATVTDANINYVGSISIDENLIKRSKLSSKILQKNTQAFKAWVFLIFKFIKF